MKKFVFITTLTPKQFITPLRAALFDLYLKSLKNQSYTNWEAIIIGEFDKKEPNITYVKNSAISKSDKLKVANEYLKNLEIKPDYIIRLDDDDVISPNALEKATMFDFDCFADEWHSYYDLTTGNTSQQKRHWLANTIIHKYEHAIAPFGDKDLPLFMHDHSQAWHVYYASKNIVWTSKNDPIYLRIISPTTITSRMNPNKTDKIESFDYESYNKYLKTFGKWKPFDFDSFKVYQEGLIMIWEDFSKQKMKLKKKSFLNFFK